MNDESALKEFFPAAGNMLAALFERMKRETPDHYGHVSRAMQAGATVRLQCCVGSAGMIDTSLWLLCPDGRTFELYVLESATLN